VARAEDGARTTLDRPGVVRGGAAVDAGEVSGEGHRGAEGGAVRAADRGRVRRLLAAGARDVDVVDFERGGRSAGRAGEAQDDRRVERGDRRGQRLGAGHITAVAGEVDRDAAFRIVDDLRVDARRIVEIRELDDRRNVAGQDAEVPVGLDRGDLAVDVDT